MSGPLVAARVDTPVDRWAGVWIAEDIEHDFPKVRIDTLAYQYTRKPPKTLRPRRNVIVRLCSIECCFAHPLETCSSPENARFRADITAWQPVAPTLYVWDYTPNFAHYQQPFPNFDALQPNVRNFARTITPASSLT